MLSQFLPVHRFFLRLHGFRFAMAAFLIPLTVRAVPEIIVGPYPVGFDTIAFYVPNTLDWAVGKTGLSETPWKHLQADSCKTLLNEF